MIIINMEGLTAWERREWQRSSGKERRGDRN